MKHFITTNPEIMGGQPCIVSTRIPISLVLIRIRQGYSLKDIQQVYDWVPLTTFEGAMEELAQQLGDKPYEPQSAQT
jgi:uncharacterized protein (DUF433 family)